MMIPAQELVRGSHELAQLLLCSDALPTAVACAAAVLPVYPYPHPLDAFWKTPTGIALERWAHDCEMTVSAMHACADAASAVLFDKQWRARAREACHRRLTSTEAVEEQVCTELHCTLAFARLQLAAATVSAAALPDGHVYVTRRNSRCHILVSDAIDLEMPTEHSFTCMQEELSADEQLQFLILTDAMASTFQRVAGGQPLALRLDAADHTVQLPGCLSFCHVCGSNWCVDGTGAATTLVKCSEPCCTNVAHRSCLGTATFTCTAHAATRGHSDFPSLPVLCCSGISLHKGAWCPELREWPASPLSAPLGHLHPLAIDAVANEAQRLVANGQWLQAPLAHGEPPLLAVLRKFGHRLAVPSGTTCGRPPWPDHLAQSSACASSQWLFSPGLAATLLQLRVYENFHLMCQRFLDAGCHRNDLDAAVQRWLTYGLPMLSGHTRHSSVAAAHMHLQAKHALLSPKALERCQLHGMRPDHWVATQVDAAYPSSHSDDWAAMHKLGFTPKPGIPPQVAAPRKYPEVKIPASKHALSVFPLRVMLNPSLHVAALDDILRWAAPLYDVAGAYDEFKRHEIPHFATVTGTEVDIFRRACVRSPHYGRVYLAMLRCPMAHNTFEADATGMLPFRGPKPRKWQVNWRVVSSLCQCTNATYVGLECGTAAYWQHILPGRRAFLFEVNADALLQLAHESLPPTTHVVPAVTQNFSLKELHAKAIVLTRSSWDLPDADGCTLHDLQARGKSKHGTQTAFMKLHAEIAWKHSTTAEDDQRAALAYTIINNLK